MSREPAKWDLIDDEALADARRLDRDKPAVNEDWERAQRQGVYCVHGKLRQACRLCKRVLTAYMPGEPR